MVTPPRFQLLPACVLLAGLCGMSAELSAQDFALEVSRGDSVFREGVFPEALDFLTEPLEGGYKGDLRFSIHAGAQYTSNMFLSDVNEQDEVTFGITPTFSYTTDPEGGALVVLNAFYSPQFKFYADRSRLNKVNHSLGFSLAMQGARTSVDAFVTYGQFSGSDRFSAVGYSEVNVFRFGVSVNRELAPRTTLNAALTAGRSDYNGPQEGSDSYSASLGFQWAATERLSFGPSLRYSPSNSSATGTRDSFAVLFDLSYEWTEHLDLQSSIGPDFFKNSRSGGGNGADLFIRMGLNYWINELWTLNASIRYDTVPAPSQENYVITNYSFDLTLMRSLDRGGIQGGISYNFTQFSPTGRVAERGDEHVYRVFVGYSRSFLPSERLQFTTDISYGMGETGSDWSVWRVGAGLSYSF